MYFRFWNVIVAVGVDVQKELVVFFVTILSDHEKTTLRCRVKVRVRVSVSVRDSFRVRVWGWG